MLDERAEPVVPELRHHAFNNNLSANERRLLPQVRLQTSFFYLCLLAGFYYWCAWRTSGGCEIAANSIAAEAQIAPGTELKP